MKISILLAALLLTACGTRSGNMAYNDLNRFKVDCNRSVQQTAFLKEQLRNTTVYDGNERAVIMHALKEIRDWCPDPKRRPSGCVAVREDFGFGSSQAVVCRRSDLGAPIKNRWESDIDN